MKIAVCDDEIIFREQIMELLRIYAIEHPDTEIIVSVYEHADDLIDAVKKIGGFDIYILDIIMPNTDGITLGIQLRADGYDGKIIYLTSSSDYAIDSFKAQPFNYIIKPVTKDKMFTILDDVVKTVEYQKEESIIVKTADGNVKIPLGNIMYAELNKNIINYHLANDKVIESCTIRISFAEAVKKLTEDMRFVKCGSSLIVNLLHITVFKSDELQFREGSSIQISRKLLTGIRIKWYDYWLSDGER